MSPEIRLSTLRRWKAEHQELAGELFRFLIVGGANTLTTYAIYLFLLQFIRYEFAYAIAYAIGIIVAYGLSTGFVFRQPIRRRSALRFPLIYAFQFIAGLGILRVAIEYFHAPHWLALGVVIILTLPVTFVLSRLIVRAS